jgi:hypothetical protein
MSEVDAVRSSTERLRGLVSTERVRVRMVTAADMRDRVAAALAEHRRDTDSLDAAARLYAALGLTALDVDMAELHEATATNILGY